MFESPASDGDACFESATAGSGGRKGTFQTGHLSIFYPEARFGGFTYVDSTIAFYLHVNALINGDSIVRDVGAGRGKCGDDPVVVRRNLRIFKARFRRVIGIDVDPEAAENPFIDE